MKHSDPPFNPVAGDGEILPSKLVPDGWMPQGWLERLEYMIACCTHQRRRTELKIQAERVRALVAAQSTVAPNRGG